MSAQVIVAASFGVTFIVVLMIIAVKFPYPTPFQYNVFRIILSLAAAGVAAMLPGFINLEINQTQALAIRAGGALAVFLIIYFYNPAKLAVQVEPIEQSNQQIPEIPDQLPNGTPFPVDKRVAFNEVWQSLIALENASQSLWKEVSSNTLVGFANKFNKASELIRRNALFFSEEDFSALQRILKAADRFWGGKVHLSEIRELEANGATPEEIEKYSKQQNVDKTKKQIRQNKRWLTHYRNLLAQIRANLYKGVH